MRTILSLVGVVGSFFLIRYREHIGDMMGEPAWMQKIGGVYNFIVIIAVFIFFWSIAELTGTTEILFKPLTFFIPGARETPIDPGAGF
jgi:uncharacterized membrane protein